MTTYTFVHFTKIGVFAAILALLTASSLSTSSWAKGGSHPRRHEVMGRDRGLAREMNNRYGHLSGHYGQLQREDSGIRKQEQGWSKQNGGYLTKGEQHQLNHEENGLQRQITADKGLPPKSQFAQNHPRRAEVLNRDTRIGGTLNADAGKLHGNFSSLKQDQNSIRAQEQADAAGDGGHITRAEQQSLNGEENQLNQQIGQDLR